MKKRYHIPILLGLTLLVTIFSVTAENAWFNWYKPSGALCYTDQKGALTEGSQTFSSNRPSGCCDVAGQYVKVAFCTDAACTGMVNAYQCTQCDVGCPSCQTCSGTSCVNICQGTPTSCGCTSCVNCDTSGTGGGRTGDGCVGTSYIDYSCSGTSCTYTTTPNDARCCTPTTCSALGKNCGSWSDGCGGTLNCGTCSSGYTCSNGMCVVSCTPTTCSALGKNCGSWSDGCSGTLNCGSCSSGETCSNGVCACTNECTTSGARQCSGTAAYQTCGNYDADPCVEWSSATSCPSGQTCSNGQCVSACTNECSPSGARQCQGTTAYRVCGNYDADSCLEWAYDACPSGQTCSNGQCVTSCTSNEVGLCRDNLDNDCDSESDYDSLDGRHGDNDCPVEIIGFAVSTLTPIAGSTVNLDCTSNVAGVNSVVGSVDGVGLCSFQQWVGNTAKFSCNVGSVGSKLIKCYVDTGKSYKQGIDRYNTLNVLASTCSGYTSNSPCEADTRCDWCPQCVSAKYTGGTARCVNAGTCPTPYCWRGQCGATCDPTQGGCISPSTCDVVTSCSCSCVSCSANTCFNSTAVRSCTSGCLGSIVNCAAGQYCSNGACISCSAEVCVDGLDNDCDGLTDCADSDCSALGACFCVTPITEICNNGKDDDCDGLIDCADPNCVSNTACQGCNTQCSTAICKPRSEVCNNGVDDDCDGNVDCVDSDCSSNLFCCVGFDCGCPTGTRLCADGICRPTCVTDTVCNNNTLCDSVEGCSCADCFNKKDTCKIGSVCNSNTKHCECGVGLLPCIDGSCNISCADCGDGIIDSGESCDGDVFPPNIGTCEDFGFDGGSLSCSVDCHFDTSACTDSYGVCGDGKRNVGEACDGLDFGVDLDPDVDGCNVLGFSGGVLDCTSDCRYDTSHCYDIPSCDSNGDCPSGAVCGVDGRCGCPGGTDLCSDGTCSDDCDSTGGGVKGCMVEDGVCEFGEGCSCADCDDGDRASCKLGSSCVGSVCSDCNLSSALWDVDNCAGNTCVVANNSLVDLAAYGSDGCLGMSFKFRVWNDKTGEVVGYPSSAVFSGNSVTSGWSVLWEDVGLWGLGSDDPVYNFFVRAVGVDPINSGNKVKVCDYDDDCDGIPNLEDECPNTPLGEDVKKDSPYKGCSPSQVECISQIDCSMVPWSECDVNNQRTRKICKNPVTGEAFFDATGDCCNQQSTCMCSLGSCSNRGNWIPTVRDCLLEEEFSFFSTVNILIVLSILICYYFFIQIRRQR